MCLFLVPFIYKIKPCLKFYENHSNTWFGWNPAGTLWIKLFSVSELTKLSFHRIEALNQHDAEKTRRESALNSLESYVFDVKTKLENEVEYKAAVTQNELESITKLYTEVSIFGILDKLMLWKILFRFLWLVKFIE